MKEMKYCLYTTSMWHITKTLSTNYKINRIFKNKYSHVMDVCKCIKHSQSYVYSYMQCIHSINGHNKLYRIGSIYQMSHSSRFLIESNNIFIMK